MKMKNIFIICFFLIPLVVLFSCGQGTDSADQNAGELKYLNTVYGGCNNTTEQNITEFIADFKNDTVFYSINGDILKITIGQNYICCAPFEVLQRQQNQNLLITLNDTCNWPDSSCYCKCPCYYDFDVYFSGYNNDTYYLKVYLHDPRQAADSLIHDVVIK